MRLRHSIMLGMISRIADRFHEYQPARSLAERMRSETRALCGLRDGMILCMTTIWGPCEYPINTAINVWTQSPYPA